MFMLSILVVACIISIPGTAYAVKVYKVSNYGGGAQIWFEAEDFDARNPATPQYFPISGEGTAAKAPDGAFGGKAMSRDGGAGGMIHYSFNISQAGGKAGKWYLWVRLISPNNQSDYLLVEGDPNNKEIPKGPPFPGGDGTAPFVNANDRVFEETTTAWTWVKPADPQGHVKTLKDGVNNMYIYHRQGDLTVFWDVFVWADKEAYKATDDDYKNAKLMGATPVYSLDKLTTTWADMKK